MWLLASNRVLGEFGRTREMSLLRRQFPQPFRIDCKASVVKWLRTWVNDRPAHVWMLYDSVSS